MALHPNLTDTADCLAFPQFPVHRNVKRSVHTTLFEDDASQVRTTDDTKHQTFELTYASQSDAERDSFEDFHDARMLSTDTYKGVFYFTDVRWGVSDIKVRFSDDEIKYSADSPRTWSWNAKLVQVLS